MFLRRCRLARPSMPGIAFPAASATTSTTTTHPYACHLNLPLLRQVCASASSCACMRMPASPYRRPCDRPIATSNVIPTPSTNLNSLLPPYRYKPIGSRSATGKTWPSPGCGARIGWVAGATPVIRLLPFLRAAPHTQEKKKRSETLWLHCNEI